MPRPECGGDVNRAAEPRDLRVRQLTERRQVLGYGQVLVDRIGVLGGALFEAGQEPPPVLGRPFRAEADEVFDRVIWLLTGGPGRRRRHGAAGAGARHEYARSERGGQ